MKYKDAIQLKRVKIIKVGHIAEICDCRVEILLLKIDVNHTIFMNDNNKHNLLRFDAAAGGNAKKI